MTEEHTQKEFKRGNTIIHIATDFCVKTPEEVEAILSRIAAQLQPEISRQKEPDKE